MTHFVNSVYHKTVIQGATDHAVDRIMWVMNYLHHILYNTCD